MILLAVASCGGPDQPACPTLPIDTDTLVLDSAPGSDTDACPLEQVMNTSTRIHRVCVGEDGWQLQVEHAPCPNGCTIAQTESCTVAWADGVLAVSGTLRWITEQRSCLPDCGDVCWTHHATCLLPPDVTGDTLLTWEGQVEPLALQDAGCLDAPPPADPWSLGCDPG